MQNQQNNSFSFLSDYEKKSENFENDRSEKIMFSKTFILR